MGVAPAHRPPTYPSGFPVEVIDVVRAASGRGVICNRPDNGLVAIEDFGAEHVAGGDLIVYTSRDSVLRSPRTWMWSRRASCMTSVCECAPR